MQFLSFLFIFLFSSLVLSGTKDPSHKPYRGKRLKGKHHHGSDLLTVHIRAKKVHDLREIVQTGDYDFGCRPVTIPTGRGDYILPAFVDLFSDGIPDDRTAAATIGKGDRFEGGKVAPRGLGSRGKNDNTNLGGIMNVDEISSAQKGLVNEYGMSTFSTFSTPYKTAEGSGGGGGLVRNENTSLYHVYMIAGVHARERGGPDNLIYFISDLLYAWKHGTGLTYGAGSFSNADVLRALSTGIVFFPLVNPDGVRFDQATDSLWRKNRNPASATSGDDFSIGVDANRNYDFLWDYRRFFDSSMTGNLTSLASDDPIEDSFHGTKPFSEPESRNVAWVFDQFPSIRWFLDIHSASCSMLYNWGNDDNQETRSNENFLNSTFDGKRGVLDGDQIYREYIAPSDLRNVISAANRTASSMNSVAGRTYTSQQSVAGLLYATSGSSTDYAFSRSQANQSLNKVYGFGMEFGYQVSFYPTTKEFQESVLDTGAGFMEFCLAAADIGLA